MKIVKKLIYVLIILLVIKLLFFRGKKQCERFENEIKTYIINLDRSPDRLKDMTEKCKKANLNFERFPAYDGSKLNLNKMINDDVSSISLSFLSILLLGSKLLIIFFGLSSKFFTLNALQ